MMDDDVSVLAIAWSWMSMWKAKHEELLVSPLVDVALDLIVTHVGEGLAFIRDFGSFCESSTDLNLMQVC